MAHLLLAPLILALLLAVIGAVMSLQTERPQLRPAGMALIAVAAVLGALRFFA